MTSQIYDATALGEQLGSTFNGFQTVADVPQDTAGAGTPPPTVPVMDASPASLHTTIPAVPVRMSLSTETKSTPIGVPWYVWQPSPQAIQPAQPALADQPMLPLVCDEARPPASLPFPWHEAPHETRPPASTPISPEMLTQPMSSPTTNGAAVNSLYAMYFTGLDEQQRDKQLAGIADIRAALELHLHKKCKGIGSEVAELENIVEDLPVTPRSHGGPNEGIGKIRILWWLVLFVWRVSTAARAIELIPLQTLTRSNETHLLHPPIRRGRLRRGIRDASAEAAHLAAPEEAFPFAGPSCGGQHRLGGGIRDASAEAAQ